MIFDILLIDLLGQRQKSFCALVFFFAKQDCSAWTVTVTVTKTKTGWGHLLHDDLVEWWFLGILSTRSQNVLSCWLDPDKSFNSWKSNLGEQKCCWSDIPSNWKLFPALCRITKTILGRSWAPFLEYFYSGNFYYETRNGHFPRAGNPVQTVVDCIWRYTVRGAVQRTYILWTWVIFNTVISCPKSRPFCVDFPNERIHSRRRDDDNRW